MALRDVSWTTNTTARGAHCADGIQPVRLPLLQKRATVRASTRASSPISRSPLAGSISTLARTEVPEAREHLFQPGVNEDLAATPYGAASRSAARRAKYDGVFAMSTARARRRPVGDRSATQRRRHRQTGGCCCWPATITPQILDVACQSEFG